MKTTIALILVLASVLLLSGCTENIRTRTFGGTMTLELEKNQKLINLTWKDANLWILTRPMKKTDSVETYTFYESSSFGTFNGTIIVKEIKTLDN